jgi:hypothetical protein
LVKPNKGAYRISAFRALAGITLLAATFISGGCGNHPGSAAKDRKVTGYASKGIISAGIVTAYGVGPGGNKILPMLAQTTTDNSGFYNLSVGTYYGPLALEVTGNYHDEATGQTATVAPDAPLKAALVPPADASPINVNVTALTKIAYDLAQSQSADFTGSINATNHEVSNSFQVPDILTTRPLDASSTLPGNASAGEIQYTLVLAAVSQIAANALPVGTVAASAQQLATALSSALASLTGQMPAAGPATTLQETIATAATQFISNPATNSTGITATDSAVQAIIATSRKNVTITLAVRNDGAVVPAFGAVQGSLSLPVGITCQANPQTGELASSALGALQGGSYVNGIFQITSSLMTLQAIRAQGLTVGNLLSVTCSAPTSLKLGVVDFTVNTATLDVNDGGLSLAGFRLEVSSVQ